MEDFFSYVSFLLGVISAVLAIVLVIGSKRLPGRNWLIAATLLTLVTMLAYRAVLVIRAFGDYNAFEDSQLLFAWYDLIRFAGLFGTVCFSIFLFVNWSATRITLDTKNLLFSFSGRIPRSAFWISIGILFPFSLALGIITFNTNAEGSLKVLILTAYTCSIALGVWVSLAIYAKRWHDCSKSGWMSLISLIPYIGMLILIIYLGFVRGADGSNQYGDDPRNVQEA